MRDAQDRLLLATLGGRLISSSGRLSAGFDDMNNDTRIIRVPNNIQYKVLLRNSDHGFSTTLSVFRHNFATQSALENQFNSVKTSS